MVGFGAWQRRLKEQRYAFKGWPRGVVGVVWGMCNRLIIVSTNHGPRESTKLKKTKDELKEDEADSSCPRLA
ncbi:uncharacterized protein G2W53_034225 [Senna tora]|uniref:Uncharacterized protein n=1 Tax=Senna tora TaxID=362788 RepID=A0A834SZX7_9FABA|nr:uncharacterized protein G2W53_034225 [Senna tora]